MLGEIAPGRAQHGGARPGSGRPRLADGAETTVPLRVRLTEALADKARRLGNGNVSEGVRRALAAYVEET